MNQFLCRSKESKQQISKAGILLYIKQCIGSNIKDAGLREETGNISPGCER
jgi:hypothetical protein